MASVVEKSYELSVLRLLGMSSAELSLFPSVQGMAISALGASFAVIIAMVSQPLVNSVLNGLAGLSGTISGLEPIHLIIAFVSTTLAGGISGCLAGYNAAMLEPTKGLRGD